MLYLKRGDPMYSKRDNYQIQAMQAKRHFLTYDQQELIDRCHLRFDEKYLYTKFLSEDYRICRRTGDMERFSGGSWISGNGFGEVMIILDWLCDSRKDRYITGRWINIVTQGHNFHRSLQEDKRDPDAELFSKNPEAFARACKALGGEALPGADVGYAIELMDGLKIFVKLWHADEDFPAKLLCMWDENTTRYIRYETTWYAVGLLMDRIKERMKDKRRCSWVNLNNPVYIRYHDEEWGRPLYDDQKLYELLILESFQAGLSWECVLNKRENFRAAFDHFDIQKVIAYDDAKLQALMNDPGIIRNRLKIQAAVKNSVVFKAIQEEFGSFCKYIWSFTQGRIVHEEFTVRTTSPLSDAISRDLKKRGMTFVGSTIIYSFLQSMGVINGHSKECMCNRE